MNLTLIMSDPSERFEVCLKNRSDVSDCHSLKLPQFCTSLFLTSLNECNYVELRFLVRGEGGSYAQFHYMCTGVKQSNKPFLELITSRLDNKII